MLQSDVGNWKMITVLYSRDCKNIVIALTLIYNKFIDNERQEQVYDR